MDSKHHIISQTILILTINLALGFSRVHWNNKIDFYDLANLRRDYLERYCLASGQDPVLDKQQLEHFVNCTKPGLVFQNVTIDLLPEELYLKHRSVFEDWCSTWDAQSDCETDNQKYVHKCFTENPSISVGFDLLTAFFESACKKKGETLPDLLIYLHMIRDWCWFDERAILSCFDHTNLHYYKRNIKLILPCVQFQLHYCGFNRNASNRIEKTIISEIESGYSSSNYVVLINVDVLQQSNETLPFAPQLPSAKCPNVTFAYMAFFILLTLVVISLGALVSLKIKSLNLPCLQKRNVLVENDGNTVEL